MRIKFLGTAAAEGVPALFCACALCRHAHKAGGLDVRTRSGAMIDEDLKIDFPPDTYHHLLKYGLDITNLENLLITHPHEDHYAYAELLYRTKGYGQLPPGAKKLTVYGGAEVGSFLEARASESNSWRDALAFQKLEAYKMRTVGEYSVTPFPARHAREFESFIYLIERAGKRILYAHDTGILFDEVFEALKGKAIDLVSLDLTYMAGDTLSDPENGHMGLPAARIVRDRLMKDGAATDKTVFVVNHFSHNGGLTHEELKREASGFTVSFDGMEIEI